MLRLARSPNHLYGLSLVEPTRKAIIFENRTQFADTEIEPILPTRLNEPNLLTRTV